MVTYRIFIVSFFKLSRALLSNSLQPHTRLPKPSLTWSCARLPSREVTLVHIYTYLRTYVLDDTYNYCKYVPHIYLRCVLNYVGFACPVHGILQQRGVGSMKGRY